MGADWLVAAAWRLWQRCSVGAMAAAAPAAVAGAVAGGARPAAAVGLGAAATYLFFSLGHAVQVATARADVRFLLPAALGAYAVQVGVATVVVGGLTAAGWPGGWVFGGVVTSVAGWLVAAVTGYRRLRVPVFDPPPETVAASGMTSPASPDRLHRDERSARQRG
ncbi:MAG: hypothetical protein LBH76_05545 [Propionibacteriaceae bacterium]|jgi:hypothetical protein|nr:hypothetical protein [Propionibacteriaceae bacterium]